jgi:hypothetical protein
MQQAFSADALGQSVSHPALKPPAGAEAQTDFASSEVKSGLPSRKRAPRCAGNGGRAPEKPGVLLRRKITTSLGREPRVVTGPLNLLYASPIVPNLFNAAHDGGILPCKLLFATEMYDRLVCVLSEAGSVPVKLLKWPSNSVRPSAVPSESKGPVKRFS